MFKINYLIRLFFSGVLLLVFSGVFGQEQEERLLQLMKQELKYNMEELKKQENAPYYMNMRAMDDYTITVVSSFGAVVSANENRMRTLVPQIRLGSPELDNFKYNMQGGVSGANAQGAQGVILPLNDDADAIREAIWRETLKRYEFARSMYDQTKMKAAVSVADEDKAPCFSKTPVEHYYEAPVAAGKQKMDIKRAWEQRMDEVSAVFKTCPELRQGSASFNFQVLRTYFVNSEGSVVVQNRVATRVMLMASLKADDGMELPLNMDYFAYTPDELPDNDRMIVDAQDMIKRLLALRDAPVADPYTGPAILSGPASGVFFHEIFGHRLEGHRLKSGGQTFKKMVGEQVLPAEFQVYSDPLLKSYVDTDLYGHYVYDDEGVKGRRVDNVVNGVLKEFLMSRVPLDGFPESNGHGRTSGGGDPVSRQSNLIIETTRPYTEDELRAMLTAEAKKQGKEYGYYFRTVTSGFTYTGEGGSLNSFNVTPLEVYRVFVDGRPDQLVRGVDMIGTPLSMFSNITAAGNNPKVFTGVCGAESGWVPVTAISPTIFVSQIETQRRAQARDIAPVLPSPKPENKVIGNTDETIFAAMRSELDRNNAALVLPGGSKPYYISYTVARYRHFQAVGSLGGLLHLSVSPWKMNGGTQLMLGDYQNNSDVQYSEQIAPAQLPSEVDYDVIRRGFWESSDMMYKYSLGMMAQKANYLQQNPLSPEEAALADMQPLPAVTRLQERRMKYDIDQAVLKQLVVEASAVFNEYKDIYNSSVVINGTEIDMYRLTTEGVQLKEPGGYVNVTVSAETRGDDGSNLGDSFSLSLLTPAEIPSVEKLKERVREFAEGLLQLKAAPPVAEYYNGPIMFEGGAVATILANNLLYRGGLVAARSLSPTRGGLADQFGQKIMDNRLTVKNYTTMKEYNGVPLYGYYEIDGDGVTPEAEMVLVEKGVFKKMLNGRIPTLKAPETTGSSRFMMSPQSPTLATGTGTIHVQAEKTMTHERMKKLLLKTAKEAGQSCAYIVRGISGSALVVYRVDLKDGKETRVRTTGFRMPDLTKLLKLVAISSKEEVMNYLPNSSPASMIYPAGMIVDGLVIDKANPKTEKEPVLKLPRQREQK
ncbi:metallopeptidase TldD-related protein [uncultured Butyricimonas sp.]|uniref:metallopeptidase TldD-related protein n=1 Tax=uncultured Butyricimonas sp. TaxID=1268785 RepID=UPI0026DB881D|nr:metallopeptidase TldD-related protein [uncultured Butyricimonas sp.]